MEKHHSHRRHRTLKRRGGAAPVLSDMRPGIYLAPGQIPDAQGHLPLSSGAKSNFGSYVQYVDKGFWNPEPAILQDAATQKVNPYSTTGNNKALAGGSLVSSALTAASFRPFIAQNPMTSGYYLQNSMKGLPSGPGANSYDNPGLKM